MYLSYKYLSKVVLFFDIEQPESLNSYKVKISVVAYVMKRQSLNESGNNSSFTGCFFNIEQLMRLRIADTYS